MKYLSIAVSASLLGLSGVLLPAWAAEKFECKSPENVEVAETIKPLIEKAKLCKGLRRKVDAGIECIGCGVCYSACDVVAWNPDYLGPAALNRAWTLIKDERDGATIERLRAVAGDAGCHACHTHMSCTERCPMGLAPTAGISGLKRAVLGSVLRGEL